MFVQPYHWPVKTPTLELIVPDIQDLIGQKRYRELRDSLASMAAADLADIISELEDDEAAVAFRLLRRDLAGDTLAELDGELQEALVSGLSTAALRAFEGMDPDDRADLLDELPADLARKLIETLPPKERRQTQTILGYPAESIGRLMTPHYLRIKPDWTVQRTIDHIRQHGRDVETIHWIYVVDNAGRLIDDLNIRTLLLADPEAPIQSLLDNSFIALSASDDQEEAVHQMTRYDRTVMPVLDTRGMLLGIVTIDDVADVAEEEATEDIQKLGGMEALDEPYMRTGFADMVKKRGPWLSALLVGEVATIFVMSSFDKQIEKLIVLATFVPLIIACGGNSGTQSASLVIRALALDEVRPADWWRIVRRELLTGATLGALLAAIGGTIVYTLGALGVVHGHEISHIALVIGVAIFCVVLWGVLLGSFFPLLLERVGLDPTASSAPLVATIMDATGMLIYFSIVMLLLADQLAAAPHG